MDLKATYNLIAEDWVKDHSSDDWWIEGTEKYLSFLDQGDSILDVGCGGGVKTEYLQNQGFEVTGIDFSEKMIEIAKRAVPAAKFYVKDITQPLGFEQKFDGVFAQAVLLHIPKAEIKKVLTNLVAVLKPDGYFYAAVKALSSDGQEEKVVTENDYGYNYERFFSFYTTEELTSYLTDLNTEIVFTHQSEGNKTQWIQVIARNKNAN